jgi:hypothetical protein
MDDPVGSPSSVIAEQGAEVLDPVVYPRIP